ncbi:MAG: tetratricopeptide repeat protein [Methanomicrobiales archaeon]|nr:tetratricopeptide repeat protein [Methanomicrobiales archaeon]
MDVSIHSTNSGILDIEFNNAINESRGMPQVEECVITAFPSIGTIQDPALIEEITFPFTINGTRYTITIPVNKNLYLAAHEGNRDISFTGPCYSSELYESRWSTLAMQPIWNDFYATITSELEYILYNNPELSDKSLIDVAEAWIQSIQYRTMNAARTLFPVEVLYERAGDCDDKALLVASLLAYNGYDAAIIEYVGHAVAGVGAKDCNGTPGYLFLETTTTQYYNLSDLISDSQPVLEGLEFPDWYQNAVIGSGFHEPTAVRKIGTGTKTYPGCVDSLYLIHEPKVSEKEAELSTLAMRAAYYTSQNQYDEALSLCDEVLAQDPGHRDASLLKALILSEREEHEEAVATVEAALLVHTNDTELREAAAIVYFTAKEYERALEENTEWIALSDLKERDEQALVQRFTILVELGMYEEAREALERLVIISPEIIEYAAQLGIQCLNMGDFDSADKQFAEILEKIPYAVDMQLLQGLALLSLGREKEAQNRFHSVGEDTTEMYLTLYNENEEPIPYFKEYKPFSERYIQFIEADPFSLPIFIARGDEELIPSSDGARVRNVTEAMRWYERAKTADPASPLAWLAIGALYESEGKQREAELAYLEAVSVDQNSTKAWYELGRFYSEMKEYEMAYSNLEQGLEIDDTYAPTWALLGDLHVRGVLPNSSDEQAIDAYEKALQADPSLYNVATKLERLYGETQADGASAIVLAAQGLTLIREGDVEEAVDILQRAVEIDPKQGGLWLDIGAAYESLEQPQRAVFAYEKALAWKDTPEAWAGLGSALMTSGDLSGAILAYERATERDGSVPEYWVKKGNVEYHFGAYDNAIHSYEKGIEAGIANPDGIFLNIIEALRKAGRISEAVEIFREVLKTSPEYKMWWELRFNDLIIEAAYDEAVEVLEVAVLLNPESGSAWNNLAVLYPRYDRLNEALYAALKATEYFGDCACSWDTLGSVYLHMKRYNEAIDAYNKAIAIDMDLMESFNNRAIAYFTTDKYEEAISSFEQAAWIQSDAPIGWYNLGVAYAAAGQLEKSNEAFSKAYALRGDYQNIRERMVREQVDPKDQFIVADGWEGFDLIPFRTGSVSVTSVQNEDFEKGNKSYSH